jgi:hypothetical protein
MAMTRTTKVTAMSALVRGVAGALLLVLSLSATAEARNWYVKARATGGNGDKDSPFGSLQEVEAASQPGDTIYVFQAPATDVLDGGIQLKDDQKLIGLGRPVATAPSNFVRARLTNSSRARYDGDIVRLAQNNVVQNLHLDNAYRTSVFGINAAGAEIRDNLMTNDMAVHDLFAIEGPAPSTCAVVNAAPVCTGEWPNGFIVFAPQTNHFGAITLVSCGPNARVLDPRPDILLRPISYCEFLVPGSGSVTTPVDVLIAGNVIRDSNSDGMMLINDTGVTANLTIDDNTVENLSQRLPDPSSVGSTNHVVRSRAVTVITIDRSVSNVELTDFVGSNLSPFGTFAADGVVFLGCGLDPVTNATLDGLLIENPFLSGDTSNGDSIEIQHRGSTNGVLNIDIRNAILKDPASTNIKLIESTNPDNGIYNVSVSNSVLSNVNTAGNEDAQIRYNGTERIATQAVWITLRNVQITGIGRGIGLTVPVPPAAQAANANPIRSFRVLVEDSSLSDLTGEAIQWSQAANVQLGTAADPPVIDLGGGPLGSHGRNRFTNNAVPGFVPEGADPRGIEQPLSADGDISVTNLSTANPPIQLWTENNYWGGGAPTVSATSRGVEVYVPTGSNVTNHIPTTYLPISVHPLSWAPR